MKKSLIGALVYYYHSSDREGEGLPRISPIINRILESDSLAPREQAWFLNQLQKLNYGADKLEEALEGAQRVIELVQDDGAYWYNLDKRPEMGTA